MNTSPIFLCNFPSEWRLVVVDADSARFFNVTPRRMAMPSNIRSLTLALVLMAPLALFGCNKKQVVDPGVENTRVFNEQIRLTTEAINEGDLDKAALHLEQAKARQATGVQRRQAESLDLLIQGTRAFIAGNAAEARKLWGEIPDPTLKREVTRAADVELKVKMD